MTNLNSKEFDFIVFDFDGVLVNSIPLKTALFREVVSTYPMEAQNEFIEFHKLHGGVSRWEKFDYFLRKIIKLTNEEELKEKTLELSTKFSILISGKLELLALTEGSRALLKSLREMGKPCFIVSGASEEEVLAIVSRTEIKNDFDSILGSPKNKQQNLESLKALGKLEGKGIFVGDSYTDYQSARDFDMKFIFMNEFSEWSNRQEVESSFYLTVKNLNELNALLINDNKAN